jgi:hypothetical protein
VHTRRENHRLPDCNVHWVTGEVSYNKHVNVVACQRLAENGFADLVFILEGATLAHKLAQVRVRVGVAMSEIASVVVMFKFDLKT